MFKMTVKEIAQAVDGILTGNGDTVITGIQYDSRAVKEGTLFAAIKGEKVDGHQFIENCFAKGAAAVFTENDVPENSTDCYIKVKNTRLALQKLAAYYRNKQNIRLIMAVGLQILKP